LVTGKDWGLKYSPEKGTESQTSGREGIKVTTQEKRGGSGGGGGGASEFIHVRKNADFHLLLRGWNITPHRKGLTTKNNGGGIDMRGGDLLHGEGPKVLCRNIIMWLKNKAKIGSSKTSLTKGLRGEGGNIQRRGLIQDGVRRYSS